MRLDGPGPLARAGASWRYWSRSFLVDLLAGAPVVPTRAVGVQYSEGARIPVQHRALLRAAAWCPALTPPLLTEHIKT